MRPKTFVRLCCQHLVHHRPPPRLRHPIPTLALAPQPYFFSLTQKTTSSRTSNAPPARVDLLSFCVCKVRKRGGGSDGGGRGPRLRHPIPTLALTPPLPSPLSPVQQYTTYTSTASPPRNGVDVELGMRRGRDNGKDSSLRLDEELQAIYRRDDALGLLEGVVVVPSHLPVPIVSAVENTPPARRHSGARARALQGWGDVQSLTAVERRHVRGGSKLVRRKDADAAALVGTSVFVEVDAERSKQETSEASCQGGGCSYNVRKSSGAGNRKIQH